MKNSARPSKAKKTPAGLTSKLSRDPRAASGRSISPDKLDAVFGDVGQKLRDGHSSEAKTLLTETLEAYDLSPDNFANLKRLLSFTLETLGQYKEALEVLKPFEDEDILGRLEHETQVKVRIQLAISYNNLTDQPKAVTLLKETLEQAKKYDIPHIAGSIDIALARVYRKLNETPIGRDYAEKALQYFRTNGDWLGMAEAYREIAISYHQEGDSKKSLKSFELGIKIIGERSAPFMLGKLYTDMSGAYWFLRQPQKGIECLEKSIEFFEQTEHILNSIIAYNNLGINLMLIGEWTKAETVIRRALELAEQTKHVHLAGILDSLGELKILREEFEEAQELLEKAVSIATERKREWYQAQAMRNLARCYLAQGDLKKAEETARQTIKLSRSIGEDHYENMAGLVLAESLLKSGSSDEALHCLSVIEENDPRNDVFVLGEIQRIRGLAALDTDDRELGLHHFNRSLTLFQTGEDLYHTALANFLIGSNLGTEHRDRAINHLTKAGDVFRKLGLKQFAARAGDKLDEIKYAAVPRSSEKPARTNSVVSQLLTVRIAEAIASRELLFRELVAVLQQDSRAKKIIIAETDAEKRLYPFITHGYSPTESNELLAKFQSAREKGTEAAFIRSRNIGLFPLKASNAPAAYLLIHPLSGAVLNDESPLQPLLRVVELGMDVISLRDKDRSEPIETKSSPYTSNSLMPGFIHSSPAMTSLVEEVYKIRSSDVTVLVTGESGTGKELVSRAIHTISTRKDKVFVPFNCTAVPKELAEGHLFGYRKGSFTGAVTDSPGMIRAADGGTLFLDEIGDLPIDVQPKLLRFLQEGEVQPIGEKRPIKVHVRVIAATNMPLEEKVAEGSFREDLYYRLNVIRLRVPPLRERRSEIPPIVNYYINHYSARFGKRDINFTPETIDLLMVCNWEGNVRQLCNEIQRIIARSVDGEVVTPEHLSPELKQYAKPLTPFNSPTKNASRIEPIATYDGAFSTFTGDIPEGTLDEAVSELEIQMIKNSLAKNSWNISRVANELGLTRRGLYLKLSRYGIEKAA